MAVMGNGNRVIKADAVGADARAFDLTALTSRAPPVALSLYLVGHAVLLLLFPAHRELVSYVLVTIAPLLAAAACFFNIFHAGDMEGWVAMTAAMILWSAGMAANMIVTLFAGVGDSVDAISMLLFVLYGVPLIFAAASPEHDPWHVRLVDGLLALTLGYLFFVHTFTFASLTGASPEGFVSLRLMFDIENLFIASFALVRYLTSADPLRRSFFGKLSIFAILYMCAAAYTNHVQMNANYGSLADLVIDLPFLALALLALGYRSMPLSRIGISPRVTHLVHAASPLMLAVTLLVVAAILFRHSPLFAIGGIAVATVGVGLRGVLVQVRSFTEQERLHTLSKIDALTGLPNRRHFDAVLQREWSRARRYGEGLTVLMIDIDHFKLLNDGLGHSTGDKRLCEVAKILSTCIARGTDLIARYGGEEFAAILPGTDQAHAIALGEAMRVAVERSRLPSPATGGIVTVSVGVGHAEIVATPNPLALFEIADVALYEAKSAGRNQLAHRSFQDRSMQH